MNVPANNKFLYFSTGAGDDGNNKAAIYPVSALRGAEASGAATIDLFFSPQRITTVAASDDTDTIRITFTGTMAAALESIGNEIAFGNDAVIKVDSTNSLFFNTAVTACNTITLAS